MKRQGVWMEVFKWCLHRCTSVRKERNYLVGKVNDTGVSNSLQLVVRTCQWCQDRALFVTGPAFTDFLSTVLTAVSVLWSVSDFENSSLLQICFKPLDKVLLLTLLLASTGMNEVLYQVDCGYFQLAPSLEWAWGGGVGLHLQIFVSHLWNPAVRVRVTFQRTSWVLGTGYKWTRIQPEPQCPCPPIALIDGKAKLDLFQHLRLWTSVTS